MLLSSFLASFLPVDKPEATYLIDSSHLKTGGIYAESAIFGSTSFFTPLSSPKPHFKATLASLMHLNSKRMNAWRPLSMQEAAFIACSRRLQNCFATSTPFTLWHFLLQPTVNASSLTANSRLLAESQKQAATGSNGRRVNAFASAYVEGLCPSR